MRTEENETNDATYDITIVTKAELGGHFFMRKEEVTNVPQKLTY